MDSQRLVANRPVRPRDPARDAALGRFMTHVFKRERTFLDPVLRPLERLIYRLTGVDEASEMRWTEYAGAMLLFSVVSMLVLYLMQRVRLWLPVESAGHGERRARPRLQHGRVLYHQHELAVVRRRVDDELLHADRWGSRTGFASAAVGMSLAIAFIRGIAQKEKDSLGNFWVDMVRGSLWILLPICIVSALVFVSQGVVQNLRPYDKAAVIDPQTVTTPGADGKPQTTVVKEQTIAQGPVASQEAIKQFGTNGGGFMNANSSHPFENPTPITNFIAMFAIFAISAGFTFTLGDFTGSRGHGWAVFAAFMFLFLVGVTTAYWAEAKGNPLLTAAGANQTVSATSPGGNMEGKEVRFGIANSALFATVTTDASCGAINGWHDSFTPLGGMVPLVNIMLSEVIFGGVGAGMYGVLIYVILAVFIAGLMVGRTPEYLGKKVNAYDVQMAMLVVLIFPLMILTFTAISVVSQTFGLPSILNPGPHGLSEVIYAFTSGAANNGSAFGGLTTNTKWYNSTLGVTMLVGRFFMIIPMLAVAGSLGRKKRIPPSLGTFPVTTPLFTALLVSVIVIVGALTFFPALSLGPIVEHLLMAKGQVF